MRSAKGLAPAAKSRGIESAAFRRLPSRLRPHIVRHENPIRGAEMAKFGIGQAVRRVEDQRFLTGAGRYVDDITLPGMVHGVNVLSPHAHARIRKIDTSKAKAAPGVLLVLTGADVA